MRYTQYFPAAYSRERKRFGVCAMTSTTIEEIRPNEIVIPIPIEKHEVLSLFLWMDYGPFTYLIGDDHHSPIRNQPTHVLLIFSTVEEKERFEKAWKETGLG